MSGTKPAPSLDDLAAQVAELKTGLKLLLGIFLVVISLPNILASLAIHQFEGIYEDTLPGQTLPDLTQAIVKHPQLVQFLSFAWPVCGLLVLGLVGRVRIWAIVTVLLIFAVGLQLALTEYAMITPLFGIPRN